MVSNMRVMAHSMRSHTKQLSLKRLRGLHLLFARNRPPGQKDAVLNFLLR